MTDQQHQPADLIEEYRLWFQRVRARFAELGASPRTARIVPASAPFPTWAYERPLEWIAAMFDSDGQARLNALQNAATGKNSLANPWGNATGLARPVLYVLFGLPGSGKTTASKALLEQLHADGVRAFRISRDDFRSMGQPTPDTGVDEEAVTAAQHGAIASLLRAGVAVIADSTNLEPEQLPKLLVLAEDAGAEIVVRDEFLQVPLEECIARDAARPAPVGEHVIRDMYEQFVKDRVAGDATSTVTS